MINKFKIILKNIQHIKSLNYEIDLSENKLHCIVGLNSVGKTTLIKAIQNLKVTTTLDDLSRLNILKEDSEICYSIDDNEYRFQSRNIDDKYILDLKGTAVAKELKDNLFVELPVPNDTRFQNYHKLKEDYKSNKAGSDSYKLQALNSTNNYDKEPSELITLLNTIYTTNKFDNLKQISIGNKLYYILPISDEKYYREDDFSSGEYMLIQIYKFIKKACKLIVIDEIDISLDSRAQINLIKELQTLTQKHEINIVFTTHSLAIMKKIDLLEENLYYMENNKGIATIQKHSYNFIKAELFQFVGYDKIILTEDKMLENYIDYILNGLPLFSKYKIIHVAGASQVIDLMKRNQSSDFFNTKDVISLLDGDKLEDFTDEEDIFFLPFLSIEKELFKLNKLRSGDRPLPLSSKAKIVINNIKFNNFDCIEFVNSFEYNSSKTEELKNKIIEFLNN